jgi:hypothetical protein
MIDFSFSLNSFILCYLNKAYANAVFGRKINLTACVCVS